jgi:hypothetical protein
MTDGFTYVVDTNVPIIANGSADVSGDCVLSCVREIKRIGQSGRVALDDKWLILGEYKRRLLTRGQRSISDQFLKWILTNQANPNRCDLVQITYKQSNACDFEEFPNHPELAAFDVSDRKFVAVAAAHDQHPPILQAADSKWWGWKKTLEECGIEVRFLCPRDIERLFTRKGR